LRRVWNQGKDGKGVARHDKCTQPACIMEISYHSPLICIINTGQFKNKMCNTTNYTLKKREKERKIVLTGK
jgi:hypothetical protein